MFPIVWPIFYADIAAVSASTIDHLRDRKPEQARAYGALLTANLALNASWTWLFFSRRRLGGAAVAAAVLTASRSDSRSGAGCNRRHGSRPALTAVAHRSRAPCRIGRPRAAATRIHEHLGELDV